MTNLPLGTEPLVLADGTKINPVDGNIVTEDILVEVPNTTQLRQEITTARRRLSDLPVVPDQMNTLSVIFTYSLYGVSDEDISSVLQLDPLALDGIKQSDVYRELQSQLVKNIMESDLADVRSLFVQEGRTAAGVMIGAMSNQEAGISTRMSAAKDVLDRGGHRPVDVVEHRHRMEGGLTIEYVEKKDDIPAITIDAEEF